MCTGRAATTVHTSTEPVNPAQAAAAQLQLMWLASPALPVGGFSYSEGLEAAIDAGWVQDEAAAATWLQDQLQLSQARSELAVAAAALVAWRALPDAADDRERASMQARVQTLNAWVLATRETSETRQQTQQMGRSLTDWLRQRAPGDARVLLLAALTPSPTWPLAFALAAERSGATPHAALCAMAFGWAENMVQAAVKALPLGQSAGQRLLGALAQAIPAAVDTALALDDHSRQAAAPMLAILSAQHQTQYSRLFRS